MRGSSATLSAATSAMSINEPVTPPRPTPVPRSRGSKKSSTLGKSVCVVVSLVVCFVHVLVSLGHLSHLLAAVKPSSSLSRLNPANITSWTVDDVSQWLLDQGLGKFVGVFEENAIDGECLLQLDNSMLKDDLGITQLGYRTRITSRVTALKQAVHPELSGY